MRNLFNLVMRVISSLLGLLVACMGGVWILQGLNIAFKVGFMVGDKQWVAWGVLAVVIGLAQIYWSNTRQA
jgi:hypothetical protein